MPSGGALVGLQVVVKNDGDRRISLGDDESYTLTVNAPSTPLSLDPIGCL